MTQDFDSDPGRPHGTQSDSSLKPVFELRQRQRGEGLLLPWPVSEKALRREFSYSLTHFAKEVTQICRGLAQALLALSRILREGGFYVIFLFRFRYKPAATCLLQATRAILKIQAPYGRFKETHTL